MGCRWFAAGCAEVELPSDEVRVTLEATVTEPACEGACIEGQCAPSGALVGSLGLADCNLSDCDGDPDDGCERTGACP